MSALLPVLSFDVELSNQTSVWQGELRPPIIAALRRGIRPADIAGFVIPIMN
jgi:hypothetical protein